MKNLHQKLLAIQEEVGAIKKESTNPFYSSRYFDINALLDALKPVLNKHKVILLQPLHETSLKTILVDVESNETMESICTLPQNPDPQKMGAVITYFRRYALTSLLALEAEDTDGNDTAIKDPVAHVTRNVPKAPFNDTPGDVPMEFTCPKDGAPMKEKRGQFGAFYGCSNYPTCKGTRDLAGNSTSK